MGVYAGPDVSENGLVLALDAGNIKGFDSNENLLTYTSNIGGPNGYLATTTATPNTTDTSALDGTFTATKLDNAGNVNTYTYSQSTALSTNTIYTYSIHIKQGTKPDFQITIDENSFGGKRYFSNFTYSTETITSGITGGVNDGDIIGSSFVKYSNGWYRLSITFRTSTASVSTFVDMMNRFGNTPGTNYVWGRQLEKGSVANPYYMTVETAKNRGTTWTNLSSNGNNGTLTNGPTYNSANGGSIVFDGTDDFSTSGALSGSFASFTVIVWFYPTSVTNYENPIDCNYAYNGSTGNIGPRLEMDNNGALAWNYSNITADNNQFYSHPVVSSGLTSNTWHCAAITYNGATNTSTTYYNGNASGLSRTLVGTPTGFVGVMNNVTIGKGFHLGGAERIFTGRVSNTLIYNRVLSASEVQQNFNATRGRFGI